MERQKELDAKKEAVQACELKLVSLRNELAVDLLGLADKIKRDRPNNDKAHQLRLQLAEFCTGYVDCDTDIDTDTSSMTVGNE